MRQLATRADWLLEQSQQHFQKLASLAVRAEGAQRMGKLAARRGLSPVQKGDISKLGHVNPSLTKIALNPITMVKTLAGVGKAAKGAVAGGAEVVEQAAKAAKAVKGAVPRSSPVGQLRAARGAPKPPVAAPKPPTAAGPASPAPSAGAAPARAAAPAAPSPVRTGAARPIPQTVAGPVRTGAGGAPQSIPPAGQAGAGRLTGAAAPPAGPAGTTPPPRGPAREIFAKQTGDSQNIVSARRMAELKGTTPVDEYARMLEAAGYGTGMGGGGASAAKSMATGAATPGAKAGGSALGRVTGTGPTGVTTPSAAAPAASAAPAPAAAAPGTQAVTPSMIQPAPAPPPMPSGAQGTGQLAGGGPYRAPGGLAGAPVAPPAPQQTLFSGAMEGLGGPAMPAPAAAPLRGGAARAASRAERQAARAAAKEQKLPRRLRGAETGGDVPAAPAAGATAPLPGGVQSLSQRAAADIAAGAPAPLPRVPATGAVGEAIEQAAQQSVSESAGDLVGAGRRWVGGLPGAVKYLPMAGLVGAGLGVGGLALGAGQALQQSGAPYRYGGGAPMPGMYSQQM